MGTSRSTSFPAEIETWSKANGEAAGKPAIKVAGAESSADARLQLKRGRIDAAAQGSETIPYVISLEPNAFTAVGEPISRVVQGMAFAKGDAQLRDAFAGALKTLIADGTYQQIVRKWKQETNAIDGVMMNGQLMN